jgi:hypothetical protein
VTNTATATAAQAPADTPATATALAPQQITVEQARGRRDQILADKDLCAKLMKGDADLRTEMHRLNEAIANEDAAAAVQSALNGIEPANEFGNITGDGILARHEIRSAAAHLIPALGSREAFESFASGRATVTEAKHNEAVQLKKMIMSDREWVAAYRSGSEAHRSQMLRINAVLSCPVAEEKT